MGACCCTEKVVDSDTYCPQTPTIRHVEPINENISAPRGLDLSFPRNRYAPTVPRTTPDPATVDKLVLETLGVIGFLVDKYALFFLIDFYTYFQLKFFNFVYTFKIIRSSTVCSFLGEFTFEKLFWAYVCTN